MIDRLVRYVRDTLHVTVKLRTWEEGQRLPLFLQDAYVYYLAEIHRVTLLLMVDADTEAHSPAAVGRHLEQVRARWNGEVVYVREQVSSYVRKRLIEAGIQFIVPGNQLYLPMLAIDLREYFRQKRTSLRKFSPATQALVLYWIYTGRGTIRDRVTATEMASVLGYTKMTMSRAFREVDAALTEVSAEGQSIAVQDAHVHGQALWERLQPYWRDPVIRRHFLPESNFDQALGLRASLTALAACSLLSEPARAVYALSQREWKVLRQRHDVTVLDFPDEQSVEVEVWCYPPKIFAPQGLNGAVDPLSLYLSLREKGDERVEMALEKLLGDVRW